MYSLRCKTLATALFVLCCSSALAAKTHINLQWAICDQDAEAVLVKLGEAGARPYKAHNITYYDSSPPLYIARGLAFRTKYKKTQPISMVKLRFEEENVHVPINTDCVWAQYGLSTSYTCGMPSPLYSSTQFLWSEGQVDFVEQYHNIDWAALVPYGPFVDPKWKFHINGHKVTFDDVTAVVAGKPLHLMEFEISAHMKHHKRVYREFTKYLRERDIVLCDQQIPKTQRLFNTLEASSRNALNHGQILTGTKSGLDGDWEL